MMIEIVSVIAALAVGALAVVAYHKVRYRLTVRRLRREFEGNFAAAMADLPVIDPAEFAGRTVDTKGMSDEVRARIAALPDFTGEFKGYFPGSAAPSDG